MTSTDCITPSSCRIKSHVWFARKRRDEKAASISIPFSRKTAPAWRASFSPTSVKGQLYQPVKSLPWFHSKRLLNLFPKLIYLWLSMTDHDDPQSFTHGISGGYSLTICEVTQLWLDWLHRNYVLLTLRRIYLWRKIIINSRTEELD